MLKPSLLGFVCGAAVAVVALVGGVARAGSKETVASGSVHVDLVTRHADGTVQAARNSPDDKQFIGCYVTASAKLNTGTGHWDTVAAGGCQSADATGKAGHCTIPPTAPGAVNHMLIVAAAAGAGAHIAFEWDAANRCVSIGINNNSRFVPAAPAQ